jgi:hypothetical protein
VSVDGPGRARVAFVASVALALSGGCACARPPVLETTLPSRPLLGTDGAPHDVRPEGSARLVVLFFFASHCPCQAAHDERLRELYARYHARGVDVLAVDSEAGATAPGDAAEAARRGYPFPIVLDPGAAFARQVRAEYATEALVVDRAGAVHYHGGIDSDAKTLHDDATPFLRDVLDDLLADLPPRRTRSKALGCALQTW